MSSLKLSISTPTQPISRGLGFYQIEEQTLFVQIGAFLNSHRFFSFIDSPISRFDIDRKGRLLFFEIKAPRHLWQVDEKLKLPEIIEPADIRWLDFRKSVEVPVVTTNRDRNILKLKFSEESVCFNYYLADNVILRVSKSRTAVELIVSGIVDDFAGREILSFRRELSGKDKIFSQSSKPSFPSITLS